MFSLRSWLFRAAVCGVTAGAFFSSLARTEAQQPALGAPLAVPTATAQSVIQTPAVTETLLADRDAEPRARTKPTPLAAPVTQPAAAPADVSPAQPKSAWYDNPPYRVIPRPGNFYVPPTGCGFYSLQDRLNGESRDAAPKSAYPAFALMPPSLFDADFRYVDNPKYQPDFLESLHRYHLGDHWMAGTGGQASWRHMHEFNSRLSGKNNDYDLFRVRTYGELWYKDSFRIYAELIMAGTANQDLPPLRIDENRADLQNLFIDVKVGEFDCKPAYVRVGRQEIMLGSQRLISALDWANTRRTFEGARGFWSNDKFDVDLFWLKPVLVDNSRFDRSDPKQNFYGAWGTYRPQKGTFFDLYYLFLDNSNRTTLLGLDVAPTSLHTLGTRYAGDRDGFLWDVEAMLQLGQRGPADIVAGSTTAGIGYNAKNLPMNPTVWAYYDWASGDRTPNSGDYNTFNQLFPFGHYYFGMIDLIGRQNIRDWNFHIYLNPAKWVTLNAQFHFFSLDTARDALYGPGGAPSRARLNGSAGGVVGQEMTYMANFHLTNRTDFFVGWAKMTAGNFVSNTGSGRSPELFYMMYNVRW